MMDSLLNKYKSKDVAFLFIDTGESKEDKEFIVKKLLSSHGYNFNVLFDYKKMEDYVVLKNYKIQDLLHKKNIDKNEYII